jgi:hypothetical protein
MQMIRSVKSRRNVAAKQMREAVDRLAESGNRVFINGLLTPRVTDNRSIEQTSLFEG